jgi:hypothetical protein
MSFEPWNLKDPFGNTVYRSLSNTPPLTRELESALRLCSSKYIHLGVIWSRLGIEAKGMEETSKRLVTRTLAGVMAGQQDSRPLQGEEALDFKASLLLTNLYELDHEDFIIHSKIFLDRMALLACSLLKDKSMPPYDFRKHRFYFRAARNIPYRRDEAYAKFIRERTAWYEPILKVYRDEFIEHNRSFTPFGVVTNPGRAPRALRRAWSSSRADIPLEGLAALRNKYLSSIPGLGNVPPNIYELMDAFETNLNVLSEEDLHSLNSIRLATGAKLPDPNEIASHLLEYVIFFDGHFLEPLVSKK